MTSKQKIAPVEMAVSIEEARTAARIDGTDLDSAIEIQVRAITEKAEHEMNRAVITQTHVVTLSAFQDVIDLAPSPLQSVSKVMYKDAAGAEQLLPEAVYTVNREIEPGRIELAQGQRWPATFARSDAVNIEFVCGYGANPANVPFAIKAYILTKVQEHFAPPGTPRAEGVDRFLDRYRVYR